MHFPPAGCWQSSQTAKGEKMINPEMMIGGGILAFIIFLISSFSSKKTILIIDDEKSIRGAYRRILRAHNILEAETAEQGYALATKHNPDLILTDHDTRSCMTGLEMIIQLRVENHRNPIILCSATDGIPEKALKKGANSSFYKPVGKEELLAQINKLL